MFNVAEDDLAVKPYVPHKSLEAARGQKHPSEAKKCMKESLY